MARASPLPPGAVSPRYVPLSEEVKRAVKLTERESQLSVPESVPLSWPLLSVPAPLSQENPMWPEVQRELL